MRWRSGKRVNQGPEFFLPDEILTSILLRLSVEDVLQCRRVCIRWRDLTSTQYFLGTHSRKSPPVVLAKSFNYRTNQSNQVMFRNWWEPGPCGSIICKVHKHPTRFNGYAANCSGDGLLVLKSEYKLRKFIVFNPTVCGKEVAIVFPRSLLFSRTEAFAIYFHPTLQQYCILWGIYQPYSVPYYDRGEKGVQYMILTLGSNPCLRKIRNPWINKVKNPFKSALLLGRYVYWLVRPIARENEEYSETFAIMEFDILSEELNLMPSPVYFAVKYHGYKEDLLYNENINLLDVGGRLSLFIISRFTEETVWQWTMVSREENSWTSTITDVKEEGGCCFSYSPRRAVACMDGVLLIDSCRLLVLNLKLRAVREVGRKSCYFSSFLPHVISLASLSNCKSRIVIEEKDGEISVKKKDDARKRLWWCRASKSWINVLNNSSSNA